MKHNPTAGTGQVFKFTFKQVCTSKGWLISTVLMAALLLIVIPALIVAVVAFTSEDEPKDKEKIIETVYVVDETEGAADYNVFAEINGEKEPITFTPYQSMDEAVSASKNVANTLVLRVTKPAEKYLISVCLPEETGISRSSANSLANDIASGFQMILMQKAELSPEAAATLKLPIETSTQMLTDQSNENNDDDDDGLKMVLNFIVPFFTLMLLYFMVLFYAQSMANTVMLEKNSKLMETILTATSPFSLLFGKLLATAAAAFMQVLIWLVCGVSGMALGTIGALTFAPDVQNEAINTIDTVMEESGSLFSVSGTILAIVMLALALVVYLALGAISGALASKAEDLSKTTFVFALVLVISFFLCLTMPTPEMMETDDLTMISAAPWLRYFPFTAMLIDPGELLLGKLPLSTGFIALGLMIVTVVAIIALSATIYKMLMLYRGNPPTPKALLTMFKQGHAAAKAEKTAKD